MPRCAPSVGLTVDTFDVRVRLRWRVWACSDPAAGIALLAGAVAALVWANTDAAGYGALWSRRISLGPPGWGQTADLRHWINDGAMTMFFFLVGAQVKQAVTVGPLRHPRQAALPAAAALGGALVPALVFTAISASLAAGDATVARGWGIPMATDPAFAVGVLTLLGHRAGPGVRAFLLALAVVDDIAAVTVIAFAYTRAPHWFWTAGAIISLLTTMALRRVGVVHLWPYLPVAVAAWWCVLHSGINATLAGVALGLLVPTRPVTDRGKDQVDVADLLLRRLTPVSSLIIVPLFALANAGIPLGPATLTAAARSPITLGVAAGLLIGKVTGIVGISALLRRLGVAHLPDGMAPAQLWGIGALGALGFTTSLFITALAYSNPHQAATAKIGILAGSAAGAALGTLLLARSHASPGRVEHRSGESTVHHQ